MQNQTSSEILKQIIYFSRDVIGFSEQNLLTLMEKARAYNAEHGITGILLYDNSTFVQCIEGKPADVDALYQKIKVDPRHESVTELFEKLTANRNFAEWLMGCIQITEEESLRLSTAKWEEMNTHSEESNGFQMMKTLWQLKKNRNLTETPVKPEPSGE